MTQIDESKKKINEHKAALAVVTALAGKTFAAMTKKEQEDFITALGQLLGVMDNTGKVK